MCKKKLDAKTSNFLFEGCTIFRSCLVHPMVQYNEGVGAIGDFVPTYVAPS